MEIAQWLIGLWNAHIAMGDAALRLGVAVALGAVIGFEREVKGGSAGLRTHMMVALAAALFTILSFEIYHIVETQQSRPAADLLRLLDAITAGVAFLAAGAIIRHGDRIKGLTTGTGLWVAGAVGMAAGLGFYALAAVAALIAVIVLGLLRMLEP